MNNSDQSQQAGAMFCAAVCISGSTGRLVKPRPTPGTVKSTTRKFDISDVQVCGENMLAVAMVGDIRFWLEVNEQTGKPRSKKEHDGHFWVARSIANWCAHFNIKSVQKVRTAIKALEASGRVVSAEFWFNGNSTTHYRLADAGGCVDINIGCVKNNIPYVKNNTPITEKYSEKYQNLNIQTSADKTGAEPAPLDPDHGSGKGEPEPLSLDPKVKTPGLAEPEKGKQVEGDHYAELAETHNMDDLLKICIDAGLVAPDRKMLGPKECRYLLPIEKQLSRPDCLIDDGLESLLMALGEHWAGFVELVTDSVDTTAPAAPSFPFIKKHLDKLSHAHTVLAAADQPKQAQPLASVAATPTPPVTEGVVNPAPAQAVMEPVSEIIIGVMHVYHPPTDEQKREWILAGWKGSNPKPPPAPKMKLTAKG